MKEMNSIGSCRQVLASFIKLKELGGYDGFICGVDYTMTGFNREEAGEQLHRFELTRACGGAAPKAHPDPAFAF